jgi:predicted O-methyltransferase YrrM
MRGKFTEKAIRLLFRLPGYRSMVQRVLNRPSEVSLTEARFLGELVRRAPAGRPIIEIGTLFGTSTRALALFKPRDTPLITVDSFRWNPHGLSRAQHAQITRSVLQDALENHQVELVQMDKRDFYGSYQGTAPGLVFLDANHSYESTKEDILWAQRVGSAIICGHDHSARFPGVIRAVEECGGASEIVESVFVLARSG